jgi:hypothetical protein
MCSSNRRVDRQSSNITASERWPRPEGANKRGKRLRLYDDGRQNALSRSIRPPGAGVCGGVIGVVGDLGSILILSSASAPSRVPHVVCVAVSYQSTRARRGCRVYLGDCHAAIQLDQVVEIAKSNRYWDKADVARVPQQVWD